MIIIRFFASHNPSIKYENIISKYNINNDADYNIKYKFTNNDNYTHAILLNSAKLSKQIPKENVIGLACEPYLFLKNYGVHIVVLQLGICGELLIQILYNTNFNIIITI